MKGFMLLCSRRTIGDEKAVEAVKKAGFTKMTWGWKTELASVRIERIPRQ
jgi:hypothetical protein